LNPDVTTLPLHFKQQGYTTRNVGKIFHNWHTKEKGDARSWSAPEFLHYATHGEDGPQVSGELPKNHASGGGRNYTSVPLTECRDVPDEAYYDGRVAAEAVRVLNEVKDKPFFLAVGFWKPHAPFNAPKKYWDMYDPAKLPPLNPARPSGAPEIAFHQSTEILGPVNEQKPLTQEQIIEMRHGYFANISYVDALLGKVLDALEKSGQADNTIVTFAGDHGYHIGEHMLWGKTSNFDNDAHVPFLISEPGSPTLGKKTKAFAELVDLFPTLVDACGLPKPEGIEGASLMPIVRGEKDSVKSVAFTQHPRPAYFDREPPFQPAAMGYSARIDNVRYTEWRDWKTGETIAHELYDHDSDPEELQNAVDDPKHAGARDKAAALLLKQFPRVKHE
jgi:iduronate 2-sulfatase